MSSTYYDDVMMCRHRWDKIDGDTPHSIGDAYPYGRQSSTPPTTPPCYPALTHLQISLALGRFPCIKIPVL